MSSDVKFMLFKLQAEISQLSPLRICPMLTYASNWILTNFMMNMFDTQIYRTF